jgi:hypothetical protein
MFSDSKTTSNIVHTKNEYPVCIEYINKYTTYYTVVFVIRLFCFAEYYEKNHDRSFAFVYDGNIGGYGTRSFIKPYMISPSGDFVDFYISKAKTNPEANIPNMEIHEICMDDSDKIVHLHLN